MLLHGVTGSGKTAVYLAAMRNVLDQGRSSILLVPEIGLTPAVAADLHQVFGDEVAILHSALTDEERAEQWHRIKRGEARSRRGHALRRVCAGAGSRADHRGRRAGFLLQAGRNAALSRRDVAVMRAQDGGGRGGARFGYSVA